jgi:arabinofuranosyltransferase
LNQNDRLDVRDAAAASVLLLPWLWLVQKYWFVCDDAFITFRYSRNLALGEGPRYNIAKELPVEGYSDFLWMVIAAVFEKAGAEPRVWMPAISAAMGGALLLWLYVFVRRHVGAGTLTAFCATLFAATFPPYAVWSTSGLETMAETFFLFGAFALLATRDDDEGATLAGLSALGLALVRTEGVAWAGVIGGVTTGMRWMQGRPIRRPALIYAAVLGVPFAVYYGWRVSYYQSWVANTALAKVHLQPITLVRGAMYVALYVATLISPAIVLWSVPTSLRSDRRPLAIGAGLMALAIPAYAVVVSGDYMTWFRILVPSVPFVVISLALAWKGWETSGGRNQVAAMGAALAVLSVLPALDVHLVPAPAREAVSIREKLGFFRSENQQWEAMNEHVATWSEKGRALKLYAKPRERYVAAAIGALGYYSDIYIYDRNGLVNREVAMQPWNGELRSPGHDKVVDRSFFFDKEPELLDSKVIGGPRLKAQIKAALREMEAAPVRETYYPEMVEVDVTPANGPRPRYLLVLRRASSKAESEAAWEAFAAAHQLVKGADGADIDLTEGADGAEGP